MDILFKCFYISQCENNRSEISEKIIHKAAKKQDRAYCQKVYSVMQFPAALM